MTLDILLSGLYSFFNTYIIPAIISLAVIFFIVNVIRYFILQSGDPAGREKARQFMIWSLLGFVIMIALWGIVNLILITIGTNNYGGAFGCPDYDPNCNPGGSTPTITSGLGSGGTLGSGSGFGSTGGSSGGLSGGGFTDPAPGFGSTPPLGSPVGDSGGLPAIPSTTSGDYSGIVNSALPSVDQLYDTDSTFLSDYLQSITGSGIADDSRLSVAVAYTQAGLISGAELNSITVAVNQVRTSSGATALTLSSIPDRPVLVSDLQTYDANLTSIQNTLDTWYGSGSIESTLAFDRMFNTSVYSYAERQANADAELALINSNNPQFNDNLRTIVDQTYALEGDYIAAGSMP